MKIDLKGSKNDLHVFVKHPKGHKEIDIIEMSKLKVKSSIGTCRIGTIYEKGEIFTSYLDFKALEEKLKEKNKTISLTSYIMR